jgi:hypothetical protein
MYIIASIIQTCSACPSQWSGKTLEGEDVYIRYRHGCLRMDINGNTVYEADEVDDDYDSYIDLQEALQHIGGVKLTEECQRKYEALR